MAAINDKPVPVGGVGIGTMRTQYGDEVIIDTGTSGFPDKPIDVMLMPVGELQAIAAVQIPRGSIVRIADPALAVHLRDAVRAMQRSAVPKLD